MNIQITKKIIFKPQYRIIKFESIGQFLETDSVRIYKLIHSLIQYNTICCFGLAQFNHRGKPILNKSM